MYPYDYLIKVENEIYESITGISQYTQEILNKQLNVEILSNPYCSFYITDYFHNIEECKNKFGSILDLDYFNFLGYFVEQIRNRKNIVKYYFENKNIIGNLTEYNIEKIIEEYKKDTDNNKEKILRLNLFNEIYLHSALNVMFFNIDFQIIQSVIKLIVKLVNIDGKDFYFYLSIILYIVVLSILFFCCFLPLINFLNRQIYRAKNMLSIIPIKILINKTNIHSLTNLFVDK